MLMALIPTPRTLILSGLWASAMFFAISLLTYFGGAPPAAPVGWRTLT
jgi:hypothetical protein